MSQPEVVDVEVLRAVAREHAANLVEQAAVVSRESAEGLEQSHPEASAEHACQAAEYRRIATEIRERTWRSVYEPPTSNVDVLVVLCTGLVHMARYGAADGTWRVAGGWAVDVSHWMPLPEPPAEE